MTTKEKDILFTQIINEYFLTQKNNMVYIPTRHLEAKSFDISDSNNALWRLKDNEIVKQYKHCWGFWEIKGSRKVFIITSEEEPKTDDDVEFYQIRKTATGRNFYQRVGLAGIFILDVANE